MRVDGVGSAAPVAPVDPIPAQDSSDTAGLLNNLVEIDSAISGLFNSGSIDQQTYDSLTSQVDTIASGDAGQVNTAIGQLSQLISGLLGGGGQPAGNTGGVGGAGGAGAAAGDPAALGDLQVMVDALTMQMSNSVSSFGQTVVEGAFESPEEVAKEKEEKEKKKGSFA